MFDLVNTTKYARRVLQHSIAIADLTIMAEDASDSKGGIHADFRNLATSMGKVVTRNDDASSFDVEHQAYMLFRSAVSIAALAKGSFSHAGAMGVLGMNFALVACKLGYTVDEIDDAAQVAVDGEREAAE